MLRAHKLLAIAAAAAAFGLSACGDSEPEPSIPLENAQTLVTTLAEIRENVEVGSCEVASTKVDELKGEIEELPSDVDDDVRQGLENGADQLGILVQDPDQCERPEEPETTTEETTTETEPTTTETTTEETTTTQPTQPTTPTTPGGGGTGGLGPAGGNP